MASIRLEDVVKVYPNGQAALRGLDLKVRDGELLVLVGPSGCGKTTTLRLIAGLEAPTAGRVTLLLWCPRSPIVSEASAISRLQRSVHGTVAVMTSPATRPCCTLTAGVHAQLAPRPEIVRVSTEARYAGTVPPLLEDVWVDGL